MLITRSELANILSTAYWSAFAIALVILLLITFKVSRTAKWRTIGSLISLLVVVGVFSIPFIPKSPKTQKAEQNAERHNTSLSETGEAPFRPVAPTKSNYKIAKALFDEKCKTAGEKIYRTVDDVEGVTLLRMPKPYTNANAYDPMWGDVAVIRKGGWYIYSLLGVTFPNYNHGSFMVSPKEKKYNEVPKKPLMQPRFGYKYVDVKDNDGYQRYTLPWGGGEAKIVGEKLQEQPSRYALTYDAPVISNERQYWIAGATIKIIDTKDNSLIAEKTVYLFDYGLGSGARGTSGRQPWAFAKNCPQNKVLRNQLRFFIEKVLKPKQPIIN